MTPHTVGLLIALTEAYLPIKSSGKIAYYTVLCLFTELYEALLISSCFSLTSRRQVWLVKYNW